MKSEIHIISADLPTSDQLEQFKAYASVPDCSRDWMLQAILKRAMLQVQEYTDKAMLSCTLRLTAYDVRHGDSLPLYQGGKTVSGALDPEGNAVEYSLDGGRIIFKGGATSVAVTYANEVSEAEVDKLMPVCWELATAIYDGEDASVQAAILAKTYGWL